MIPGLTRRYLSRCIKFNGNQKLPGRRRGNERTFSSLRDYLHFNSRVAEALKNSEPVVALESTIVAHGMPFPQNLETAQSVESIVQSEVRM